MWDGIKEIFKLLKVGKRKKKWHKLHPNSDTTPMNDFDFEHVLIGKGTYGELNVVDFGGNAKLIINNYVSIAQHVSFILNAEHYTDHISTYPFKVKILRTQNTESFSKGNIIVDDDVWIGYGATIMSGVHIGQGAVVAAGAIVTKDIPPYAIVGGVPAKIINYRFEDAIIKELLKVDFKMIDEHLISTYQDDLYEKLTTIEQLKWLPKKGEF